jgi:leader peptidase (prepilin peptidase) / N-methyltransferase
MPVIAHLPQLQLGILLGSVLFFGMLWGSFLNVVIYRLPLGESVVKPRSRCPGCKKLITWYQNIPLLSWILLRGRCANCGMKISARYPLVEVLTGIMFLLAAAWRPDPILLWPFHFWFMGALIACTFIDLDHWILPDKITLPGIGIGLAATTLEAWLDPSTGLHAPAWQALALSFGGGLIGVVVGGGILYLVAWGYKAYSGIDGLGGGDIKFLAMVGAFLGVRGALATLILGSLLGSMLGIFLITLRGKKAGTAIQFGPFLALGSAAAFFFGDALWKWYFNF